MELAEYSNYDGLGLAALVESGEVTPTELAALALEAIELLDPRLNAIAEVYRECIDGLSEESLPPGPFRGVPFLVKRIGISEQGRPVSDLGTQWLQELELPRCEEDSYVVRRFKEAGLNIIGRSVIPELAYTITVESPHQGIARNPWDANRIAGGSSTGSCTAVAAGILPMAHATDAAGSTRFPASVNGLVGLKPSRGRVSNGPGGSDISSLKVSHLAVTRTVRDSAAMLDALEGGLPGESTLSARSERPFLQEVGAPPGRLRIALSSMSWHTCELHPEVRAQIEAVGNVLEELGHDVSVDKPGIDFEAYRDMYRSVFYMDGSVSIRNAELLVGSPVERGKLQPVIRRVLERADRFGVHDYAAAIDATNVLARRLGAFFTEYDVLLTPALTEPVPKLGRFSLQSDLSGDEFLHQLLGCNQHLPLANLTGVPAISLPLCETAGGVPLGAHFIAAMGDDARLIRLSSQLEEAMPWRSRKPRLHLSAIESSPPG